MSQTRNFFMLEPYWFEFETFTPTNKLDNKNTILVRRRRKNNNTLSVAFI